MRRAAIAMRGASARALQVNYHVPISNTASGWMLMEPVRGLAAGRGSTVCRRDSVFIRLRVLELT
jgi:hypothetical protein